MTEVREAVDQLLHTVRILKNNVEDDFQNSMQSLTETFNTILQKYQQVDTASPLVSKTPFRKRKLNMINEEKDEGARKKSRSSLSLDIESESHSTPKTSKKQESPVNSTATIAEAEVSNLENTRVRRNASILAAARTTSMLCDKFTKMRAPSKADIILAEQSNLLSSSTRRATRNKKGQTSIAQKMDIDDENKENSITITGKVPNTEDVCKNPPSSRITRNTSVLNEIKEDNKNTSATTATTVKGDVDLMPPPQLPVKRGRKKVLKTRSVRSKNRKALDETESEDDLSIQKEEAKENVENNSVVEPTEETESNQSHNTRGRGRKKNPVYVESPVKIERPKRATRRNKAKENDAENTVDLSKLSQSADNDSVDTGNETNKSGQTRRTTKKNKAAAAKIITSTTIEEIPKALVTSESTLSKDSGIETIDKIEESTNNETAIIARVETPVKSVPRTTRSSKSSTPNKQHPERGTFVVKKKSSIEKPSTDINEIDKPQILNDTIVISSNSNKGQIANETVVLSSTDSTKKKKQNETFTTKAILTEDEQNSSILTDDLSEVDETPPKANMTKILGTYTKKFKEYFSPIKDKVQHFEKLASDENGEPPKKLTRTKTRSMAVKENDGAIVKNTPPSSEKDKLMSPIPVYKINGSSIPIVHPQIVKPVVPLKKPALNLIQAANLLKSPVNMNSAANRPAPPSSNKQNDDASKKKEALLHAISEEKKRKREEKTKAAALAREAQEKQKHAELERLEKEKAEKSRLLQLEREEKMRKDLERKKIELEKRAAETEERRRRDEAARQARLLEQEEETKKQQELKLKQQKEHEKFRKKQLAEEREIAAAKKLQDLAVAKLLGSKKTSSVSSVDSNIPTFKSFNDLHTDDESEDEKGNGKRAIPNWSQRRERKEAHYIQSFMKDSTVDKFYSSTICNPDFLEIFPFVEPKKLNRTSSVIWRTPPRFSMIPQNFNMNDDD